MFSVKVRTDQFFNIYRLKKKGGFFGSLFFLKDFSHIGTVFRTQQKNDTNENNLSYTNSKLFDSM